MSLRAADRSAEPAYAFTAQLWGSMVVSYEIGQESTQRLILQELKGPVGPILSRLGRTHFSRALLRRKLRGPNEAILAPE